jgi:hypothetical protein
VTPNSDWWDRAKTPPKPETVPIRPRDRVCTLRDQHEATLETRAVIGDWKELIFSINTRWRRTRVFKPNEPLLSGAVAATITELEARGWRIADVTRLDPYQ